MIKRYKVTINDVEYRVSVESVKGGWEESARPLPPVAGFRPEKPAPALRPEPVKPQAARMPEPEKAISKPQASPAEGAKEITAPLPGNM